jgi:hypothetical protein
VAPRNPRPLTDERGDAKYLDTFNAVLRAVADALARTVATRFGLVAFLVAAVRRRTRPAGVVIGVSAIAVVPCFPVKLMCPSASVDGLKGVTTDGLRARHA